MSGEYESVIDQPWVTDNIQMTKAGVFPSDDFILNLTKFVCNITLLSNDSISDVHVHIQKEKNVRQLVSHKALTSDDNFFNLR